MIDYVETAEIEHFLEIHRTAYRDGLELGRNDLMFQCRPSDGASFSKFKGDDALIYCLSYSDAYAEGFFDDEMPPLTAYVHDIAEGAFMASRDIKYGAPFNPNSNDLPAGIGQNFDERRYAFLIGYEFIWDCSQS